MTTNALLIALGLLLGICMFLFVAASPAGMWPS